jgi:hypothetical protein
MELKFECTVVKLEETPRFSPTASYVSVETAGEADLYFTMLKPCSLRVGDVILVTVVSKP